MEIQALVICMANYCRSPVAEILLNKRFKNNITFSSAGLIQFDKTNMDRRSLEYLSKKGIKNCFHQPKMITESMIIKAEFVLAIDIKILIQLNKNFPKYTNKFKLFSLKNEKIIVNDPYTLDDVQYIKIMNKIEYISSNISFET